MIAQITLPLRAVPRHTGCCAGSTSLRCSFSLPSAQFWTISWPGCLLTPGTTSDGSRPSPRWTPLVPSCPDIATPFDITSTSTPTSPHQQVTRPCFCWSVSNPTSPLSPQPWTLANVMMISRAAPASRPFSVWFPSPSQFLYSSCVRPQCLLCQSSPMWCPPVVCLWFVCNNGALQQRTVQEIDLSNATFDTQFVITVLMCLGPQHQERTWIRESWSVTNFGLLNLSAILHLTASLADWPCAIGSSDGNCSNSRVPQCPTGKHVALGLSCRHQIFHACPQFWGAWSSQLQSASLHELLRSRPFSGSCPCSALHANHTIVVHHIWWSQWHHQSLGSQNACRLKECLALIEVVAYLLKDGSPGIYLHSASYHLELSRTRSFSGLYTL